METKCLKYLLLSLSSSLLLLSFLPTLTRSEVIVTIIVHDFYVWRESGGKKKHLEGKNQNNGSIPGCRQSSQNYTLTHSKRKRWNFGYLSALDRKSGLGYPSALNRESGLGYLSALNRESGRNFCVRVNATAESLGDRETVFHVSLTAHHPRTLQPTPSPPRLFC